MRVLLADDHTLLVEGLQNLLEAHDIEVVGVARNGREAVVQARATRPDVILMDIRMPVCDGLAATRLIKAEMPEARIVILTTSSESEDLFEAIKSGAAGYLLKSMDAEGLIAALHDAEHDTPPFAPGLASRLLAEFSHSGGGPSASEAGHGRDAANGSGQAADASAAGPPAVARDVVHDGLSARQVEVLTLVAQGLSYKEVGERVFLSPRTVKYHMAETMRKLHLENRAQVLAHAAAIIADGDIDAHR